jgi:hypothetical protein
MMRVIDWRAIEERGMLVYLSMYFLIETTSVAVSMYG